MFNPGSSVDEIVEKVRELATAHQRPSIKEMCAGFERGDVRALARLITAVQRGENLGRWSPPPGSAKIIGVTGSPGVGKSSFIARLGRQLRDKNKKVAVVAVDPSSPITGGALLGDRLRMMTGSPDEGFFVRSLSSGKTQGGLGPHCAEVVDLLNGFGFDYVLVETVGAGQADVAVHELTKDILLLLMPDSGDVVQFSKAGIMEIARAFVINKSDLAGVDVTEAQLLSAVGDDRPIWQVSSVHEEDAGIDSVAEWVLSL